MSSFDPIDPDYDMDDIDYDEIAEMIEDYGFGAYKMERTDDCKYDYDNYGFAN